MKKETWTRLITLVIIAGNILFFLWILYNGINENFEGTLPEKISYFTLMTLLAVNALLLLRSSRIKS